MNAVDHDEIPHPSDAADEQGRPVMVPNPYNVVVSVMMLKEGWDVRNVKVIRDAAGKEWQAAAWWLERRRPGDFGKREPLAIREMMLSRAFSISIYRSS